MEVFVEANAVKNLFIEHAEKETSEYKFTLAEGAKLNVIRMVQAPPSEKVELKGEVSLGKNSEFNSYVFPFSGSFSHNLTVNLLDKGASSSLFGLDLGRESSKCEHNTVVNHKSPHTQSKQIYKGVYGDKSNGVFNSLVFVHEGADKTDAVQSSKNLLLSDNAEAHPCPQLEIYADDVKCAHGATVGQLDEEALFYLRSRGLPESKARRMLVYAFVQDVISMLPDEEMEKSVSAKVHETMGKMADLGTV